MNRFIIYLTIAILSTNLSAKNVFYMIKGNIFDLHSPIHEDAEDLYKEFIQDHYSTAHFKSIHNNNWKALCRDLKSIEKITSIESLIVIGHSWGAQTAISLAHCMKRKKIKKTIDIFFAFDVIRKPLHKNAKIIPDNIELVYNWYQSQSFLLKGLHNLRRKDGTRKGIFEEHLVFKRNQKWLHDRTMYLKIIDGTIFDTITNSIK